MKKKSIIVGIIITTLLVFYSFADHSTKSAEFKTRTIEKEQFVVTKPKTVLTDRNVISYSESTEWLEQLDSEERLEQIRDWAVVSLAALLNVDAHTFRDYAFDKTPIRDPIFSDLAENFIGKGRRFLDSQSTLHLLVPKDDPYAARTIGLLLDDNRKDSGIDPALVQIHRYRIYEKNKNVELSSKPPRATSRVRIENGYHEQALETLADVKNFLANTQHLSRFEIRQEKIWAAGWLWPGTPSRKITPEDLAVLQRGYQNAKSYLTPEPGFSLDPGPSGLENLLGVVNPADYADYRPVLNYFYKVVYSEEEYDDLGQEFSSHQRDFFNALALSATGLYGYQYARYEGGLKGTEAGMTYFYTDIVAKGWPMEKGEGNPNGIVPGFISDIKAKTPWGHCSSAAESGRLWFGLRENAVSIFENRVDFGRVATRLFSLIKNPNAPNEEIEPSYSFGRIMWWWDRHYTAMADYEPQFHRLDQLMRWGAAIGWLVEHKRQRLPELPNKKVSDSLNFGDWLDAHPELKWRYDIPFVKPQHVNTEALLILQSQYHSDCGYDESVWYGGISNPARHRISTLLKSRPKLDGKAARGGMDKLYTSYSNVTKSGKIGNENIVRNLSKVLNKAASVEVKAAGRKVWSLGDIKIWAKETVPRRLGLNLSVDARRITQRIGVNGIEIGELSVAAKSNTATVLWKPGPMARVRQVLSSVQDRLNVPRRSLSEAVSGSKGGSFIYNEPGTGRIFLRASGQGKMRWVALEEGEQAAGNSMAFRLAGPNPSGQGTKFYQARVVKSPGLTASNNTPAKWLNFESAASKGPVRVSGTNSPPPGLKAMQFEYQGGQKGVLYAKNNRFWTRVDDPVFGLDAPGEGATLLNKASISQIAKVRQATRAAGDGYSQATLLRDGKVGLVDINKVSLVKKSHPWHQRLKTVLNESQKKSVSVKVDKRKLAIVDKLEIESIGSPEGTVKLSDFIKVSNGTTTTFQARAPPELPTFMRNNQAAIILEEGKIPHGFIGKKWQVRILEVKSKKGNIEPSVQSDISIWDKTEWVQINPLSTSAPMRSIRVIYHLDDCEDDEQYLRCSEQI